MSAVDQDALRARVQRTLAARIGAPAIQLTDDLLDADGPLAPLLAAVTRVEALADELADEAGPRPVIERSVAALRVYKALRGDPC